MDGAFLGACTKNVLNWMRCISSDGSGRGKSVGSIDCGMRSLALSCVLCSNRVSVMHFILNGGVVALAGIFKVRGTTALMTRYMVCAAELMSLTAGPMGCEALMGKWKSVKDKIASDPKGDPDILHVPGIVSAKLSKENPTRKSLPHSSKLPPGMIASAKRAEEDAVDERNRMEIEPSLSRRDQRYEDEDSGRKRSSKKKEKKKHKSKHKSRDRSSDRHESRRSREDKESRKHRHHRRSSAEKKKSKSKDTPNSNGLGSQKRDAHNFRSRETMPEEVEEKLESVNHTFKRQKCDHPQERATCIDLRMCDNLSGRSISLYDMLFDILLQPRPQGIVQSIKR